MSAIAGIWHRDGSPESGADLDRMLTALRSYGTDATQAWVEASVGLGYAQTILLPEDAFDLQPVTLAGGRFRVVADVRLDNREELAAEFGLTQAEAAAMSDAGLLARAFERWGTACLDRLLGDYSFAVWDARERSWLLARDPVGMRPLFYFSSEKIFAFASMPAGLLALPEIPCEPNEDLLSQVIELVPRPDSLERNGMSMFRGIHKVPGGHFIEVKPRHEKLHRYWNPSREELRFNRPEMYYEALREELDRAVQRRLRGTKDVAAHLSGGLDSSSVTATAARLQEMQGRRVTAYTAVPQTPTQTALANGFSDEREHASATADLYPNVDHVLITSEGRSPFSALPGSFDLYQQPLISLCNMAWLNAIQDDAARRGFRVILSGVAGNHTLSFTGLEMLPAMLRAGQWADLWSTTKDLHRVRGMSFKSLTARTLAPWIPSAMRRAMVPFFRQANRAGAHHVTLLHPTRVQQRLDLPVAPPLSSEMDAVELRMQLLHRVDDAALRKGLLAGWGLDERDPTSDRRLVEFCFRVPPVEFLRGGLPSALVREGLADRLPEVVRHETRKGWQGTDWYIEATRAGAERSALIERLDSSAAVRDFLNMPRLRKMAERWPTEGWNSPALTYAYRTSFLRSLSVGQFLWDVERMCRGRRA